jgi:hypothetical protein
VWDEPTRGVHIVVCEQMIPVYVATRPVLIECRCRQGEQKIGAVSHSWWWEQQMDLDLNNAIRSDE